MCELASGFYDICESSGGIDTSYAFTVWNYTLNQSNIATLTIANGECTALTLVAGKTAFPINYRQETGFFTDEKTEGAGGYARAQTTTLMVFGNTKEMITNIEGMAKSRTAVINKLNDGTFELMLWEKGGKTTDSRASGTATEDMNGTTLTISGKSTQKAVKISSTIVLALLA